jgi:hypothetical protein
MVSEDGTYYQELMGLIQSAPDDLRTILLSATPMFDKPHEIGLTINLLRPEKSFPVGSEFNDMFISAKKNKDGIVKYEMKNKDLFIEYIKCYISFFRGNIPFTFAQRVDKGILPNGMLFTPVVKCFMKPFQYNTYLETTKNFEDTIIRNYGDIS